jgi:hypothetical protein
VITRTTPDKYTVIQHTPFGAAGTAGTEREWRRLARRLGNPAGGPVLRVGGGSLAVLLVLLWLTTLGLMRWAETPPELAIAYTGDWA